MTDDKQLPCKGKFCKRPGLPFLPVRVAYVPNGFKDSLPSGIANSTYADSVYRKFSAGASMLRLITEGYVFIHDPRDGMGWRGFAATPDGRFKEITVSDDERPEKQPKFSCSRAGDSIEASLLSIEQAKDADEKIWVGYSRVWWTKSVRKQMLSDSALRKVFMVSIDAKALYGGADPASDIGFRLGDKGKALGAVLEYLPFHQVTEKLYAETTSKTAMDRSKEKAPLAARMKAKSNGYDGIVLTLPDIVGLAMDTACWRNIKAGDLAHYKIAQADMRAYMVRSLIEGVKSSMETNGQSEEWADRYAPKLDMGKVKTDQDAYDAEVTMRTTLIQQASTDWLAVVNSDEFKLVWLAYDGAEHDIGLMLEHDVAHSVKGSGALEKEKAWWKPWLLSAPDDKKHPLWLALAAGDPDVVKYLKSHIPDGVDAFKMAREEADHFREWLKSRQAKNALRQGTEESGTIAGIVVALLPQMLKTQAAQLEVIGARLRVIVAVRADTLVTPTSIKTSVKQVVGMLYETGWGPPTAKMTKKVIKARRALITQGMDGGFIGGQFTDAKAMELDIWLPEDQVKQLETTSAKILGSNASAVKALNAPLDNPFTATKNFVRSFDAKLIGLAGALAVWNLISALHGVDEALGEAGKMRSQDLKNSLFGAVTGVMAVSATVNETIGKVLAKRVTAGVARTVAAEAMTQAVMFEMVGSLFAMGAAWTTSVQDLSKAWGLAETGDSDAAKAYVWAGAMMFVSGAASAAAVIVGGAATLEAAGATGALAGILIAVGGTDSMLAMIPVAGWIAAALVTLGAGIYLAYKALSDEDTPLEVWFSRCYYRNDHEYDNTMRTKYQNIKDGMTAFQNAVYGLQIVLDWSDSWFFGKDGLNVRVVMPGYGVHSDYAFALQVRGSQDTRYAWGWSDIDHKYSSFSGDPELKPRERRTYVSEVKPGQKLIPMDDVLEMDEPFVLTVKKGVAILHGKFSLNSDYLDHARLKFEYWPDAANRPQLMMTPAPNGVNFREVHD